MSDRRRWLGFAVVTAVWMIATDPPAQARPPHKKALADYLGPGLARKLNDCRTCHLVPEEGADPAEDRPHNAFGKRLKAVRPELKKGGKPSGIPARVEAIAGEDSDGDGVPNLLELVTGHFPGEADDTPGEAELARGREAIAALERARSGYPWNPFERVERPELPVDRSQGWVRNPIDAFIAVEHTVRGLTPRPEASRPVILRRLYLDLTGLPPTPEELHDFLADGSPGAYETVVDRLLASPRYGERWGRHWMDVWRYSDWAGWGQQVRDSQPHIWHWRDWIVESLNRDKPYDRMVVEMLAADEDRPEDLDALRATGYLARNFKLLSREKWMQDVVDHTGQAFLGVTIGCARCHDHMYDPILQKDYYQVRAIFEPHQVRIDKLPGAIDTVKDGIPRLMMRSSMRRRSCSSEATTDTRPAILYRPASPNRWADDTRSSRYRRPSRPGARVDGWPSPDGSRIGPTRSPPGWPSTISGAATSAGRSSHRSTTSVATASRRPTRLCSTGWPPS